MTYKECSDIWASNIKDPKSFEEFCNKNPDKVIMIYLTIKEALDKCHEIFEMDTEWEVRPNDNRQ